MGAYRAEGGKREILMSYYLLRILLLLRPLLGRCGSILERKEGMDDWIEEEVKVEKFHRQRVRVRRGRLTL